MDQTENNQNKKRKAWLVPLIWLFGIGLTGGLIITGLSLSKKNKQVAGLEQELSQTSSTLNSEKDSLFKELQLATNNAVVLQTKNETLDAGLSELKNKNNRLAHQNNNLVEREQNCNNNYNKLLASVGQLRSDNETLRNSLAGQQTVSESLRTELMNRDSLLAAQGKVIDNQKGKLKADSASSVALIDSVIHENSSNFINITELNGAYGINIRNVPYAHYFYGISNVSGLFVNKHFISGIGVGVLAYNSGVTAPLYLDFRYHFSKRTFTPYLYADGGLILKFDYMKEPMLFINPGVGLYKSISDKFALNLGAGIFIQRDDVAKASFLNFKLGLIYLKGGK